MKLLSIDIVLENCEVINVPAKYLNTFYMDNIIECISCYGLQDIIKSKISKDTIIQLNKKLNDQEYTIFGHNSKELENCPHTIFDRLINHPDITHIDINYEDGSHEYIGVNYKEDKYQQNIYMSHTYINDNLYIRICENKTIDDFIKENT